MIELSENIKTELKSAMDKKIDAAQNKVNKAGEPDILTLFDSKKEYKGVFPDNYPAIIVNLFNSDSDIQKKLSALKTAFGENSTEVDMFADHYLSEMFDYMINERLDIDVRTDDHRSLVAELYPEVKAQKLLSELKSDIEKLGLTTKLTTDCNADYTPTLFISLDPKINLNLNSVDDFDNGIIKVVQKKDGNGAYLSAILSPYMGDDEDILALITDTKSVTKNLIKVLNIIAKYQF